LALLALFSALALVALDLDALAARLPVLATDPFFAADFAAASLAFGRADVRAAAGAPMASAATSRAERPATVAARRAARTRARHERGANRWEGATTGSSRRDGEPGMRQRWYGRPAGKVRRT
jgi:hypothetical protein